MLWGQIIGIIIWASQNVIYEHVKALSSSRFNREPTASVTNNICAVTEWYSLDILSEYSVNVLRLKKNNLIFYFLSGKYFTSISCNFIWIQYKSRKIVSCEGIWGQLWDEIDMCCVLYQPYNMFCRKVCTVGRNLFLDLIQHWTEVFQTLPASNLLEL